eukprot:8439061-Pyramimonas_sp.AAC.1
MSVCGTLTTDQSDAVTVRKTFTRVKNGEEMNAPVAYTTHTQHIQGLVKGSMSDRCGALVEAHLRDARLVRAVRHVPFQPRLLILRCTVSGLHSVRVAQFQGCTVLGLQIFRCARFRVAQFQGCTVLGMHGFRAARVAQFQGCTVLGLLSFRVAQFWGCTVLGLHGFRDAQFQGSSVR